MQRHLTITPSPHVRDRASTKNIMQEVCLALAPAGIASVILFGAAALKLICFSVLTCVLTEYLYQLITGHKSTVGDWSAVVTGLMLAYNLPATAPWWIPVVGGVIAILLVKQMFGGIGSNFMNPALTARAVLFISWGGLVASYPNTVYCGGVDTISSATPLAVMAADPSQVKFMDLLLGNVPGILGETCKIALLLGGAYLIIRQIIDWRIPACFIGTVFVLYLLTSGFNFELAVKEIFAGGLMLGAFFMATDYATCPLSRKGRILMGLGCGIFTFVIRAYANYPEGTSFAILFMNVLTPLIDRYTMPKCFGEVKKHA